MVRALGDLDAVFEFWQIRGENGLRTLLVRAALDVLLRCPYPFR